MIVCYSRGGHVTSHMATWGSPKSGQGEMGMRGKDTQEPLMWFHIRRSRVQDEQEEDRRGRINRFRTG